MLNVEKMIPIEFGCQRSRTLTMWDATLVCLTYCTVQLQFYGQIGILDYTILAVSGKVGPVNHTSWAVVSPTDRPKSVHYQCVIELFGGVFLC